MAGGAAAEIELDETIANQLAAHGAALLQAAECKPAELADRVAEVVKDWGGE